MSHHQYRELETVEEEWEKVQVNVILHRPLGDIWTSELGGQELQSHTKDFLCTASAFTHLFRFGHHEHVADDHLYLPWQAQDVHADSALRLARENAQEYCRNLKDNVSQRQPQALNIEEQIKLGIARHRGDEELCGGFAAVSNPWRL